MRSLTFSMESILLQSFSSINKAENKWMCVSGILPVWSVFVILIDYLKSGGLAPSGVKTFLCSKSLLLLKLQFIISTLNSLNLESLHQFWYSTIWSKSGLHIVCYSLFYFFVNDILVTAINIINVLLASKKL